MGFVNSWVEDTKRAEFEAAPLRADLNPSAFNPTLYPYCNNPAYDWTTLGVDANQSGVFSWTDIGCRKMLAADSYALDSGGISVTVLRKETEVLNQTILSRQDFFALGADEFRFYIIHTFSTKVRALSICPPALLDCL